MAKSELRARMRQARKALSAESRAEASASVCRQLMARAEVEAAIAAGRVIAVYLAAAEELELAEFIAWAGERGARLAAPRWNGSEYELAALGGELVEGPHGIMEPSAEAEKAEGGDAAVWIVPGLAFDRRGNRLGYGGGWYDRMLAKRGEGAVVLGVAYEFQVVEGVASEGYDVRLDGLVVA